VAEEVAPRAAGLNYVFERLPNLEQQLAACVGMSLLTIVLRINRQPLWRLETENHESPFMAAPRRFHFSELAPVARKITPASALQSKKTARRARSSSG